MRHVTKHQRKNFFISMHTLATLIVLFIAIGVVNAQPCRLQGICYALDNSGSVSGNYGQIKSFTVASARTFASPDVQTSYSASWFNSNAGVIQAPTTDLEGVFVPKIGADSLRNGGTNIYRGLQNCFNQLQGDGARAIIVVTDGMGASNPNPLPQIREDGVAVVSVGVGNNVDEGFLRSIATRPEFFLTTDFDILPDLAGSIQDAACDAVAMVKCEEAYDTCDFTFAGVSSVPTFNVAGKADVPFTPRIVRKSNQDGSLIGVVNSQAGEFEPIFADTNQPISLEGEQNFAPTAFKTFALQNGGSAIGHETFQGNQQTVADGRCVVVYFQSWQVLNAADGVVIENTNLAKRQNSACVAFMTST